MPNRLKSSLHLFHEPSLWHKKGTPSSLREFRESLDFALLGGVLHSHSDGSADHGVVAHRRLRLREEANQSPQTLDFTAFDQLARQ